MENELTDWLSGEISANFVDLGEYRYVFTCDGKEAWKLVSSIYDAKVRRLSVTFFQEYLNLHGDYRRVTPLPKRAPTK